MYLRTDKRVDDLEGERIAYFKEDLIKLAGVMSFVDEVMTSLMVRQEGYTPCHTTIISETMIIV